MKFINGYIIFSLIFTCSYLVGLLFFLTDYEENKCEMTYMFEYPQFVRVSNKADKVYKKYELYAYSEGRFTEKARNMYFDGIPVLFIPGNAGSYKQVRSLASVALRKALNSKTSFHFDYFTVNLNDELSGLNGGLLMEQTAYVNHSMYRVLELYKNRKNPPASVILIGHSMGGTIARYIAQEADQNDNPIPVLITLSSAHTRPPYFSDAHMVAFYNKIANSLALQDTTFVSISGGYNDFLVPAYLTRLKEDNALSVTTSTVPKAWLPVDHLCIVWCKQLVLAITRALFDMVDRSTGQITDNLELRKNIFHHYLVHDSGTRPHKYQQYGSNNKVIMDSHGKWIENINRQYSVVLTDDTREQQWYMIRLVDLPKHEMLTVVAVNLELVDWIFACGAYVPYPNSISCQDGYHLTHLSEIAPSARHKRRQITLNLHELKYQYGDQISHVAFRVGPTDEPVMFHVDVYSADERTIVVDEMPSFKSNVLIQETEEKAVAYTLQLPILHHIWQSFVLDIKPYGCSRQQHHARASLRTPWDGQSVHKYFTELDSTHFHVRLYSPRPLKFNESATIQLTLDPHCRYSVSIRSSVIGTLGQIARFYSPLIVANIAAIILLSLSAQIDRLAIDNPIIFFKAIQKGAKPYFVLTAVKLMSNIFNQPAVRKYLPQTDWNILGDDNTDFILLPLIVYLISIGLTWLLAIALGVSLFVFESTVQRTALKFLAKTVTLNISWSDYFMTALKKLPFIVAGTLVCLSITTCGGLALCLGAVFYFLKLSQISQDCMEGLVWGIIKRFAKRLKQKLFKKNVIINCDSSDSISSVLRLNNDEALISSQNNNAEDNSSMCNLAVFDDTDLGVTTSGETNNKDKDNSEKADKKTDITEDNASMCNLAVFEDRNSESTRRRDKKQDKDNSSMCNLAVFKDLHSEPTSSGDNKQEEDNSSMCNLAVFKDLNSGSTSSENKIKDEDNSSMCNLAVFKDLDSETASSGDKSRDKEIQEKDKVELNEDNSYNFRSRHVSVEQFNKEQIEKEETEKQENEDRKIEEEMVLQNSLFFHVPIFMIWMLVTLINVPFVLTWARNFKYSPMLQPDPSSFPGLVLSVCAFPLWQLEFPSYHRKYSIELSFLLKALGIICLGFGCISVYRLSYFLPAAVAFIVLVLLVAPAVDGSSVESEATEETQTSESNHSSPDTVTTETDNEDDIEEKYENIKTKME